MSQRKVTKAGGITPAFAAQAALDPEGALSYMLMSAFGVSLSMLITTAKRILTEKNAPIAIIALTAGVQIRNNVVFVGREYGDMRRNYPELLIEGEREQRDIFNFGALHVLGHILAHITSRDLGNKILRKAGSSVSGEYLMETEAGLINGEFFKGWTTEERMAWSASLVELKTLAQVWVDSLVDSMSVKSKAFQAKLTAPPGAAVVPPRKASVAPGGT